MSTDAGQFPPEVIALYERLNRDAEAGGYHLNPERDFSLMLVEGLYKNQQRYGYQMCPCRLAFGEKEKDLDLICPCDYRDADLDRYGMCYCGFYVSRTFIDGTLRQQVVPERRPTEYVLTGFLPATKDVAPGRTLKTVLPVWRCRVCGYLCAREQPPEVCPVCKVKKDRFERFPMGA
jgi:ferredoxin-thioredoxin reductase catalytic subunit/rubredoxin